MRKKLSEDSFPARAWASGTEDTQDGAFPWATWKGLADATAERGASPSFGLATAPDRSWAAIAVAWRREDGAAQVMLTQEAVDRCDYRSDTDWVADRMKALRTRWGGDVRVDKASRGLLEDALELTRDEQTLAEQARCGTWWPPASCATATTRR
jgi:hypothetical protein